MNGLMIVVKPSRRMRSLFAAERDPDANATGRRASKDGLASEISSACGQRKAVRKLAAFFVCEATRRSRRAAHMLSTIGQQAGTRQ